MHNCEEIKSLVKQDNKLSKLAKETFDGNSQLSKEVNRALKQLENGNMNPGIGTKKIHKNIFEARTNGGGRIYFRQNGEKIEILAYSNKNNQQEVINRLKVVYPE